MLTPALSVAIGVEFTALCHDPGVDPSSSDTIPVTCPYCGEDVEIFIEEDVRGSFVQDCEVCCNPWLVRVGGRTGERDVSIGRADGSE